MEQVKKISIVDKAEKVIKGMNDKEIIANEVIRKKTKQKRKLGWHFVGGSPSYFEVAGGTD